MKCQSGSAGTVCLIERKQCSPFIFVGWVSTWLSNKRKSFCPCEKIIQQRATHSAQCDKVCVCVYKVGWRTDLCHWFQIAVTSLEVDVTVYLAFSSYQVILHWWFFTSLILLFHVFTSFSNCFACMRGNLLITGSWKQFQGSKDVAFH